MRSGDKRGGCLQCHIVPKIKPELVRRLYLLKHSENKKKPMTKHVNEAVELYLKLKLKEGENGKEGNNDS